MISMNNPATADEVDAYISGRLSDEALDTFEEALMTDTALQQQITMQLEMNAGLSDHQTELLELKPSLFEKLRAILNTSSWSYGVTAVLALFVVSAVLGPESDEVLGVSSAVFDDVIFIGSTRSMSEVVVTISTKARTVVSVDVADFINEPIRLSIHRPHGDGKRPLDGGEVYHLEQLAGNSQALLSFLMPQLAAGDYQLVLQSQNREQSYPLKLISE